MSLQPSDDPLTWKFKAGPLKGQYMIRIDDDTGCWLWQGGKGDGYGKIKIPSRMFPGLRGGARQQDREGWTQLWVHQLTYFMRHGNPPRGRELGHTCSRRSCCNPEHVRPITPQMNKAEMFMLPKLSSEEIDLIAERLLADYPMRYIANEIGVSIWAVRKISQRVGLQQELELAEEVPF